MKSPVRIAAVAALMLILCLGIVAQTSSVFTTGLTTPNKIVIGPDNSLIVAEAGTRTPNTGRISIVDRTTGARHTLISGLPSAVSFLGGPAGDADGPSGLLLRGNTLFVTIGIGDAVVPGGGPGLELPNPATPSSPLFDSVLEITLPGGFADLASSFSLTLANQATLASGSDVTLSNAEGHPLTIHLVANLPDYRPNPLPSNPNNVKASHIYGVELFQRTLYLVDAGHNSIKAVNRDTGDVSVLVAFPNRANPLFPTVGGPFIEAVPDNIHRFGNRLLVPLLTGFPFVAGLAEVRSVGIKEGDNEGLIPNLTSAIDVLKVETETTAPSILSFESGKNVLSKEALKAPEFAPGFDNSYYTLEFSTNLLGGAPGRLRFYSAPDATPVNLLTNLITPNSMARDDDTGNLFITNIGPGTVTKVVFP